MDGLDILGGWSYFGIIFFLILTGCGFPLPEEVAFVYAGVQTAVGNLNPILAVAACGVGALLGDCVMYGIGRLGRGWIGRHAWFSKVVHLEREEQIRRLIAKHGIKVFFVARFMVGVRGPLYVTLGILKVSFWRFVLIDAICASVVISVFFALSFYFGQAVLEWIRQGEWLITVVASAAVVIGGGVLWYLHYQSKKKEAAQLAAAPPPIDAGHTVSESLLGVTQEELLHAPEATGENGAHRASGAAQRDPRDSTVGEAPT